MRFLPGDELEVNCSFDSRPTKEYTHFGKTLPVSQKKASHSVSGFERGFNCSLERTLGDATSDEMCIAILQYYPKQANAQNCWGFLYNDDAQLSFCGIFVSNFERL